MPESSKLCMSRVFDKAALQSEIAAHGRFDFNKGQLGLHTLEGLQQAVASVKSIAFEGPITFRVVCSHLFPSLSYRPPMAIGLLVLLLETVVGLPRVPGLVPLLLPLRNLPLPTPLPLLSALQL